MEPAQGRGHLETLRQVPSTYAKYALLLPLILANLVVFGFEDQYLLMKRVSRWLAALTLILALYASRVGRVYSLVAALLTLFTVAAWGYAQSHHGGWVEIAIVVTFGALMVMAPAAILRRVRREFLEGGVDSEVILGVLCTYLYLGNWYAFLYRSLAVLSDKPFFAQPGAEDALNYLYFSFVTLATVGYGDLSPAYGPGRMLAATEGIVGQLYLVSVVALVVSQYRGRREPRP